MSVVSLASGLERCAGRRPGLSQTDGGQHTGAADTRWGRADHVTATRDLAEVTGKAADVKCASGQLPAENGMGSPASALTPHPVQSR